MKLSTFFFIPITTYHKASPQAERETEKKKKKRQKTSNWLNKTQKRCSNQATTDPPS
jgi:nitric oxide reductase activation protein